MHNTRTLGLELMALGLTIATAATLGPFGIGVIRYHTSASGLSQITGGDAAALLLVAPACIAAGLLSLRGHRAAPALALAPALFAAYTYAQLICGEEYGQRPGNNERFFPLLYLAFVLGCTAAVTSWRVIGRTAPPAPTPRLRRTAAATLFTVVLLLAAQHLPTLADAMRDTPQRAEYLASPTAFWLVKLMDLGLVAPAAFVTGAGLLRDAAWARPPMYALVGAYTLLGASVTGMAITMIVRRDPAASQAFAAGFGALTLAFAALIYALCRPLFGADTEPRGSRATRRDAALPARSGADGQDRAVTGTL
ncbi:hypothetical protein Dvina_32050 [Dactylosporangium vinaceum]|uniref:Integral membrane protein n=1 Tax=Dactylosporangium vinaceum TaxID=53362 RepID=A0ABV5MB47_9ACTN|nr:hypothetical protein [Dactylosporangium vinaceum]UAB92929.1 hypothetical protein Dvina_32050 [Dactylosporangium vinaceum]